MNRDTAAVLLSPTIPGAQNARWETPPKVWEKLQEDFGPFDLDLTADSQNHLLPTWLGPGSPISTDCLQVPWHSIAQSGYSNPEYGPFVPLILKKALLEAKLGFSSTLLLPLRVTKTFRKIILVRAHQVLFCDKRICFYEDGHPRWNETHFKKTGKLRADGAPFDSVIVRFLPGMCFRPQFGEWHVPKHVFK